MKYVKYKTRFFGTDATTAFPRLPHLGGDSSHPVSKRITILQRERRIKKTGSYGIPLLNPCFAFSLYIQFSLMESYLFY